MSFYVRKISINSETGYQVWNSSHGRLRPVDGNIVYPSLQEADAVRKQLDENVLWREYKVSICVDMECYPSVLEYIEERLRYATPFVRLPYNYRNNGVVNIVFYYICCIDGVEVLGLQSWSPRPMTYKQLVDWLESLDLTLPVIQKSIIES